MTDFSLATYAQKAPVTGERKLNTDLQSRLPKPCFREIGCSIIFSVFAAIFINLGIGFASRPGWFFSPLLPIYIKNIHKGKHGSDSETYDTEGRFDPSKFDAIFSKYALTNSNFLTSEELDTMLRANRNNLDFFGWIISFGEWKLLYVLAKDEQGLLHRETIRSVFDGSLFEQLAKMRAATSKGN